MADGGVALKVLRDDTFGEMSISGTRSDLLALCRELRSGRAEMRASKAADPRPYDRSLSRIEFRPASGKVHISSLEDGESMEIRGGLEFLAFLAEVIEGFALEADQDDHLHVDYFPGHYYLVEESDSLVIEFDDGEPNSL
ncbi:hypothetical protein [Amycolatopsis sp. NPDC001319]|uniref:Imm32 family immunity protein n=1 Tax=unclassified Amycolatopsis TaxID=2618356 RepID=UPI00368BD684